MSHSESPEQGSRLERKGPSRTGEHMTSAQESKIQGVTDVENKPDIEKELHLSYLVDTLVDNIIHLQPDDQTCKTILMFLPQWLLLFAMRGHYQAKTPTEVDLWLFVEKNHQHINDSVKQNLLAQNGIPSIQSPMASIGHDILQIRTQRTQENLDAVGRSLEDAAGDDHAPSLAAQLSKLQLHQPAEARQHPTSSNTERRDSGIRSSDQPAFSLLETEAFQWLLAKLRSEMLLVSPEEKVIEVIRNDITDHILMRHSPGGFGLNSYHEILFTMDWDVITFLAEQNYMYPAKHSISVERVITITGTRNDGQALTLAQYLTQTWPSMGAIMLRVVKDAVAGGTGLVEIPSSLPGEILLFPSIERQKFRLVVIGDASFVAEAGEVLAWIGAALRTSPYSDRLAYCSPVITWLDTFNCSIDFRIEEIPQQTIPSNGQCWHRMFKNAVIVKGFPIRRKLEARVGLEIPLNVMAGLVRTKRIEQFDGRHFIKGFSAMLVPTKRSGDIIIWHYVYKQDGSYISYLDASGANYEHVETVDVETSRHIVGWCMEAVIHAGSPEAKPVDGSDLPNSQPGGLFSKFAISPGKHIMGGSPYMLGVKDTPIYISEDGYIPRLKWISKKFVLLWDEADKRGWLVNGTTALLHLVRASLDHDSEDEFKSAFLFRKELLQESEHPYKTNSATHVLINEDNRKLPIYRNRDGHIQFEDRVEYMHSVLERLINYQLSVSRDIKELESHPRRNLEGWDLRDLATNVDPLLSRVARLATEGKGWVDFVRATHTITLFGSGFGDLIQATSTNQCKYWSQLPKNRYYLAVAVQDLRQILKLHGNAHASSVEIAKGLIWHSPGELFASCLCKSALTKDHCDPVQTFFPTNLAAKLLPRDSLPLDNHGAYIFGYNPLFDWNWGDTGDPQEGGSNVPLQPFEQAADNDDTRTKSPSSIEDSTTQNLSVSSSITSLSFETSIPAAQDHIQRQYTVGIICPLPKEFMAIRILLDEIHEAIHTAKEDTNHYILGRIGCHNVVATCLPSGEYGTNSAAITASGMKSSFPKVRFCLLVGIGGGVSSDKSDVHLGDVVVSHPERNLPGVIQYDLAKALQNNIFELTGTLRPPPRVLLGAISHLKSDPMADESFVKYLKDIEDCRNEYRRPVQDQDHCSENRPEVHYGLIASGNLVIKDIQTRDRIAREYGAICFEMEAAGVMNVLPCLVIRGISDYADPQKNNVWQKYAAAAAASYAKLLLSVVKPLEDAEERRLTESRKRKSSPAELSSRKIKKI
ncbi:hypothetical protein HDV64DRAFT_287875 [Trichoderma sp. TUCIM 5745]